MSQVHAIVWLDHREARVIGFSIGKKETIEVSSNREERRIHHKMKAIGSGKLADDHHFFDEIAAVLTDMQEVLIVGPGNAKTAFETYLLHRHADVGKRVVGRETLDHPSEGELLAHARKYFEAHDQLGLR